MLMEGHISRVSTPAKQPIYNFEAALKQLRLGQFKASNTPSIGRGVKLSKGPCPVDKSVMKLYFSRRNRVNNDLKVPDISAGLGNREESKNIAALEKYVVSAEHWLNDHGTLCLYSTPYWRRLEGEDNAVREIRTILSPHADISNSLTAYDYAKIYRGLKSNPAVPVLGDLEPIPYTINCRDGTLNLLTREVRPPCPEDYFFYAFDLSCSQVLEPPMYGDHFETFVR